MYVQTARFGFRLGKSERDQYLIEKLNTYQQNGGNASDLVKALLYVHFTDGQGLPADIASPTPKISERESKLSSKLKKMSFGGLSA